MQFYQSEKLDHKFLHDFIFGPMFPESHGFVAMPITSCIKDTHSNLSLSDYFRETKLFELVTGGPVQQLLRKPWLSGNKLSNMKKNMWKWMVKFLRKSENRGEKIAIVDSIRPLPALHCTYLLIAMIILSFIYVLAKVKEDRATSTNISVSSISKWSND